MKMVQYHNIVLWACGRLLVWEAICPADIFACSIPPIYLNFLSSSFYSFFCILFSKTLYFYNEQTLELLVYHHVCTPFQRFHCTQLVYDCRNYTLGLETTILLTVTIENWVASYICICSFLFLGMAFEVEKNISVIFYPSRT